MTDTLTDRERATKEALEGMLRCADMHVEWPLGPYYQASTKALAAYKPIPKRVPVIPELTNDEWDALRNRFKTDCFNQYTIERAVQIYNIIRDFTAKELPPT